MCVFTHTPFPPPLLCIPPREANCLFSCFEAVVNDFEQFSLRFKWGITVWVLLVLLPKQHTIGEQLRWGLAFSPQQKPFGGQLFSYCILGARIDQCLYGTFVQVGWPNIGPAPLTCQPCSYGRVLYAILLNYNIVLNKYAPKSWDNSPW